MSGQALRVGRRPFIFGRDEEKDQFVFHEIIGIARETTLTPFVI